MNWTPQRKIRLGFWLVAVVPIIMGVLGILSLRSLFRNADILAHTNHTIRQLDKVYVGLSDVESAESEYLMTGSEAAVKPYLDATARLDQDLQVLEPLTRDNLDQRLWLQHLQTLVGQKINETRRIVELLHSGDANAAAQLRQQLARGVRTMDDVRTTVRRIRDAEERQLTNRTAAQHWDERWSFITFLLVVAVNVVLVYSLYFLIQREAAEARREEERMRELAAELEERVDQRTDALRRSNEDLQQFAYIVSHDLQEPLRMVGTYTELLRRKYGGRLSEDADEYINFAVDGVKRMTALIRGLLEYSRAGEADDKAPEPVNAEEALETVLLDLRARIEDAGAQVTHDQLPTVVTHRVWFAQLLQNLVGNALKYRSEQPPRVHISARQDHHQVTFAVSDNGIGIDPKYADQVFGVFKRLHGRDVEGTGIGLAMCKKIVERSGGRIWFESEPGKGSTFYFTVPAAQAMSTARAS